MQTYLEQKIKDKRICGIDEAGRGNLAGPMVVAGCILDDDLPNELIQQIDDSKKTTKTYREKIVQTIKNHSKYAICVVDVDYINQYGPKKASIYGMENVAKQLINNADEIWTDAEKINISKPNKNIIHGDALSLNIAAASIIAKYEKDKLMDEFCDLHEEYNVYDFRNNAGYGTKKHLEALKTYGKILDFHRLNYAPVKNTNKIFAKIS